MKIIVETQTAWTVRSLVSAEPDKPFTNVRSIEVADGAYVIRTKIGAAPEQIAEIIPAGTVLSCKPTAA